MNKLIRELESQDPRSRFRALQALRHEYAPEVGKALVRHCITEPKRQVWWLSVRCTLPIWLPLFDETLRSYTQWPFSGPQTIRMLQLSGEHILHSAGQYIPAWIEGSDWVYKFAAFRWLKAAGTMQEACEAANRLLYSIHTFSVSELDETLEHSWMQGFDDRRLRESELTSFLEENS